MWKKGVFIYKAADQMGKVTGVKGVGMIRHPFAVHKDTNIQAYKKPQPGWFITHLPTGVRMNPKPYGTRKAAMKVGDKLISKFGDRLQCDIMENYDLRAEIRPYIMG